MNEIRISLEGQSSKSVESLDMDSIDTVITLCGDAAENCPTFPRPVEKTHWALDDPAKATGAAEEPQKIAWDTRQDWKARQAADIGSQEFLIGELV